MSAEALHLPGVAAAAESARPVRFVVDRRVDLSLLNRWQRFGYLLLCRKLKGALRVPPAPTMYRGTFDTFAEADGACDSPDDQVHVLPAGWAFAGDTVEPDIVCRPRDRKDGGRYLRLRERYGDEEEYAALADVSDRLDRMAGRVRAAL